MQPKMMPGQTPYTTDELKKLYRAVDDAAEAGVTEQDEVEGLLHPICTYCGRVVRTYPGEEILSCWPIFLPPSKSPTQRITDPFFKHRSYTATCLVISGYGHATGRR